MFSYESCRKSNCLSTFAGTLTVNSPISLPFLHRVLVIQLLALHLLDLVLPDALPHDVRDRGGDQTEMDVNLHSRKKGVCKQEP